MNNSNFTFLFVKAADLANVGAKRNFKGSQWQVFKHIFLIFSDISAKMCHV